MSAEQKTTSLWNAFANSWTTVLTVRQELDIETYQRLKAGLGQGLKDLLVYFSEIRRMINWSKEPFLKNGLSLISVAGVDQAILARSVEVALSCMSGRTTLSSPVFFSSFWFFMHFIKRECIFDFLWPIEIKNSFLTESQMFPYQLSQTSCVLIKNMRIVCNWSVVLSHFTAYHDHVTWIILKLYLSRET